MAHAQKPDFVFRRNGRVHLNRWGASVKSSAGSRGVRISGSDAAYTNFRGGVKSTGYPLHSPVSPSLPLPCVTVCHQVSNALYQLDATIVIYYHKYLYMFRTSICPSSGVQVVCYCIWCSALERIKLFGAPRQ